MLVCVTEEAKATTWSVLEELKELSVDGGKIRLRTPLGEPCIWRDYKGIRIHEQITEAFF